MRHQDFEEEEHGQSYTGDLEGEDRLGPASEAPGPIGVVRCMYTVQLRSLLRQLIH